MKVQLLTNLLFLHSSLKKGAIFDVDVIIRKPNGEESVLLNVSGGARSFVYQNNKVIYQSPTFDTFRVLAHSDRIVDGCWVKRKDVITLDMLDNQEALNLLKTRPLW